MSRRFVTLLLLYFLLFSSAFAIKLGYREEKPSATALADSLAEKASLLAARGQVAELRPIYKRAGKTFPPDVRLYCELALAQADHRWERVESCIDSLTTTYSSSLDLKGLIALCLLKAETMHRLGHYESLQAYASERLAYFQSRRVKASLLAPFRTLARKARRLSGSDWRTQLLQKVEAGDANALLQCSQEEISRLDDYARWRCRLLLATAYNRPDVAAETADSLLFHKSDSLDANDYISCVHTAARALMTTGRWKDLNHLAIRLMQRKKSRLLWERYLQISKVFQHCGPTRVSCPKGQTIALDMQPAWPPLVRVGLGDDYLPFTLSTGTANTIITEADAKAAGVTLSTDTVSVTSAIGLVRAVTAVADSLAFGPVVIYHPVVYVAIDGELSGDSIDRQMVRTLGLLDLSRLGCVELTRESFQIVDGPSAGLWPQKEDANMRFTSYGTLLFDEKAGERRRTWLVNTAYPDNMAGCRFLTANDDTMGTVSCEIHMGMPVPCRVILKKTEDGMVDADGVLGYSFISRMLPLRLDFKRCSFQAVSE